MLKSSSRLSKRTAVFVIIAGAALLAALVLAFALPAEADPATTEGRLAYLKELGWDCDAATEERETVLLPARFGEVLEEYNRLQKTQGFDLAPYAGTDCLRFTYVVTNYPSEGTVLAQLFIRGSRVIAGDIHSAALDGFMHTLK